MTTALDTHEQVDLDVDLHAEVPCSWDDCTIPARWAVTARHTPAGGICHTLPYCEPHVTRLRHLRAISDLSPQGYIACLDHRTRVDLTWRPL